MFFKECFRTGSWEYFIFQTLQEVGCGHTFHLRSKVMTSITYYHEAIIMIPSVKKQNKPNKQTNKQKTPLTALGRCV